MAGILIVYICVIVSWEITCVIFNLGGTRASVAFFDALDAELDTLSLAHRAFVHVEKAGTHVSNFDWGGDLMSGVCQMFRFRLYRNLLRKLVFF